MNSNRRPGPSGGKDEAMEVLLRFVIENGVAALIVAIPVALLGLLLRRPALLHALWVIVLLKLLTPASSQFRWRFHRFDRKTGRPRSPPPSSPNRAPTRRSLPGCGRTARNGSRPLLPARQWRPPRKARW